MLLTEKGARGKGRQHSPSTGETRSAVSAPDIGSKFHAQLARSRLPARVVSGTFLGPAHAEGHWLAASGAIKIYCATDSSKYGMARQAYCIFWQN
jgi:hypothetical protein